MSVDMIMRIVDAKWFVLPFMDITDAERYYR